jgi:hypothetical protein
MSRGVEKARRQAEAQRVAHLQAVMETVPGRAFVWAVLDRTGLNADLMANNAGTTSYLLGRRAVGLDLLRDLKQHTFDDYRRMEDEALARDARALAVQPQPDDDDPE